MTEVTAEAKFIVRNKDAGMTQCKWTGETTIYVDKSDYENLGDYIHEINEAEIFQILFCEFNIDAENYPIVLAPIYWNLIEDKTRNRLVESIIHLISPYGYNCLIGRNNKPKW